MWPPGNPERIADSTELFYSHPTRPAMPAGPTLQTCHWHVCLTLQLDSKEKDRAGLGANPPRLRGTLVVIALHAPHHSLAALMNHRLAFAGFVRHAGARLPELVVILSRLPAFLVLTERFINPQQRLWQLESQPHLCWQNHTCCRLFHRVRRPWRPGGSAALAARACARTAPHRRTFIPGPERSPEHEDLICRL